MSRFYKYTDIPTWLKHKPIYAIKRYEQIDGLYKNESDVIGLSLGKAQWSGDGFVPSVKVWRDTKISAKQGYQISRQSEETTLTRALDLALLVVSVYDSFANNKHIKNEITNTIFGNIKIDFVGNDDLIKELKAFFTKDNLNDIKTHIKILKDTINNIKL